MSSTRNLLLLSILRVHVYFRDIRSTHVDEGRINSFDSRAENFFQKFLHNAGTVVVNGMPYLHYLRNHIGKLMKLYKNLFGFGYGYFSTSAGEHLNKRIKHFELVDTNLDTQRFYTIIHLMRTKQFEFTECIFPSRKEIICSACSQTGHNKKNKSCPMHPTHPVIQFEDSDDGETTYD